MKFYLTSIPSKLSERLLRQNPRTVRVSPHEIRSHVIGKEKMFTFRILEGEKPSYDLPGVPFRLLACIPDPGATLFPIPVGHFDYRIVRGNIGGDTAISTMCHDPLFLGDKTALKVVDKIRKDVRGVGRAMTSIVLNHVASESVEALTLHDVLDTKFFYDYSKTARIVDRYRIDKNGEETITMELDAEPEKEIQRIILSSRSEPIQQVLKNLSIHSPES